MERNLLKPTGEIKELFKKHFQKLMQTYGIKDYLLLTNSTDAKCLIRGSPERLSALIINALENNENLRKIIVNFLRQANLLEVKKHE